MKLTEQEYAAMMIKRGQSVAAAKPPRHAMPKTDRMNKLEARYAREVLDIQQMAGEIIGWKYEAVKLRLADRTWYTPDFMVIFNYHIEMHETKGFMRDDAMVKLKVAAEMFKEFQFVLVQLKGGVWIYEEF